MIRKAKINGFRKSKAESVELWLRKLEGIVGVSGDIFQDEKVREDFFAADQRFNTEYEKALDAGLAIEVGGFKREYDALINKVERAGQKAILQGKIEVGKEGTISKPGEWKGYVLTEDGYVKADQQHLII